MPVITLPDGSTKQFEKSVTVYEVAMSIGERLAKAALAGKVDGQLVDTVYEIENDASVAIITDKDEEGLDIIRHSAAHLLAHAVKALYPETQITIGPVIENGFYYDISWPAGFKPEDMEKIETRMKEIAQQDLPVTHEVVDRKKAVQLFRKMGEAYKAEIIEDLPENEAITLYKQGDFIDLCRGPHVPNVNRLKAFKLTKLAGAYWRGDSNNEMLQRIYGTAWPDKKALKQYLNMLEEAKKRDHRELAKKMKLFHLQEEAPGMVFWHENGWQLYRNMQAYVREKMEKYGYQEIRTPQLVDHSLWEKSGHAAKFGEEMFLVESENRTYAIKPMNCPCHIQVYKQGVTSYRDLPLRFSEFGSCHRNEPSGTLHGLLRVRNMVQDDGHIFCTEEQIESEVSMFIDQLFEMYKDFGFTDIGVKLSTRPDKRVGSDEIWDKAERALEASLNHKNLKWKLQPGEGAFYGPKVEFDMRDCIGRVWQLGTIQLDFSMPGRLEATYIDEDGSKKTPVMLHRAVLGSFERFIGVLLEHYAGVLPLWLAPKQAVIVNITAKQAKYAQSVAETLKKRGIRAYADLRNEKIGFKIREHSIQRVPYVLVVGDKEVSEKAVTIRTQAGEDLGSMPLSEFVKKAVDEVSAKAGGGKY